MEALHERPPPHVEPFQLGGSYGEIGDGGEDLVLRPPQLARPRAAVPPGRNGEYVVQLGARRGQGRFLELDARQRGLLCKNLKFHQTCIFV